MTKGMDIDEAVKPIDEIGKGVDFQNTSDSLTCARPQLDRSALNSWRIDYMEKNLFRCSYVSGDTVDLAKWINDHMSAIVVKIAIDFPNRPAMI